MKTSWDAIARHIGTINGPDIANELVNRKTLVIPKPEYSEEALKAHVEATERRDKQHKRIQSARTGRATELKKKVVDGDTLAGMDLATLLTEIEEAKHQATLPLPMVLEGNDATEHSSMWRTYRERVAKLVTHRGQAFSMVLGQCMQVLLDKMKYDPDWDAVSVSYDPLQLLKLIERIVMAQTEDQYPFATVYQQELGLYAFHQQELTNEQWC